MQAKTDAEYWNKEWASSEEWPTNNFAKKAYRLANQRHLKPLLDLGCGDGKDSVYFYKMGFSVTAVDFSIVGINKVKARDPHISRIHSDITKLNLDKNSFDVIYAHLSLHYFDDRTTIQIFKNIHRALRKSGLLFVKCKSVDDPQFGKGEQVGPTMYIRGHLRHFFSKEYMSKVLSHFEMLSLRRSSSEYAGYRSAFIEAIATK